MGPSVLELVGPLMWMMLFGCLTKDVKVDLV